MRAILTALLAAGTLCTSPALAQDVAPADAGVAAAVPAADQGGDFAIVGLGVGVLPDYEGSDDYGVSPVPAAIGRVGGFNFTFAGNRVSVDLIPDSVGPGWDFQAGPIGVVNLNRSSTRGIEEDAIRALGKVDTAIELGGYVGIGRTGVVTSDFDRLSLSVSYRYDVAGGHESGILAPTLSYVTPLSTKALVGLIASAEHVENGYADAYFSVTPTQSVASGLRAYNADGGWKNWTLGGVAAHSLTGDITGGVQLFGTVVYRRLLNDFADSPITADVGSKNQWLGAIGVAYSF